MPNAPTRVAVVGVGNVGRSHLEAYADNPLADVEGLVDVDPERAESMADRFDVSRVETDLERLLERTSIDAVSVATPENHHLEPTRTALARDCHVLLEKPIADTLAEAREIVDLAERSTAELTIGYMRRFVPEFAALKERVADGDVGEVLGINAAHVGRVSAYDHAADWTHPVYYMGVHEIDLLRWLLEAEAAWVFASASDGLDGQDTPAIVSSQIGFENGTVATLETNWGRRDEYPNVSTTSIEITGTEGYASVSTEQNHASLSTFEGVEYLEPWKYHGSLHGRKHDMYSWEIDHFVRCVRHGESPLVTAEDGYASLEVANAIIESTESRDVVRLS